MSQQMVMLPLSVGPPAKPYVPGSSTVIHCVYRLYGRPRSVVLKFAGQLAEHEAGAQRKGLGELLLNEAGVLVHMRRLMPGAMVAVGGSEPETNAPNWFRLKGASVGSFHLKVMGVPCVGTADRGVDGADVGLAVDRG